MFPIIRRRKTIGTFIRSNRTLLDTEIRKACPNVGTLNDRQREFWILNYQPLYNLALSHKVQLWKEMQ